MLLRINRNSNKPLYLQIAEQYRDMILSGVLPTGYRLPPERKLAQQLEVNRTTILNAYRALKADNLVDAQVGHGTVVKPGKQPETAISAENLVPPLWQHLFSKQALRSDDSLTRDILALAGNRELISFAAGIPSPDSDPMEQLGDQMNQMIAELGASLFHHTPTEGLSAFRQALCDYSLERGIHATVSETMVLSGSQQGLSLIADMFLEPGDVVLAEEPTFFCARQMFEARGANVVGIPMDAEGIQLEQLEAYLIRMNPKFIYVVPTFQNPTGMVMSLKRRKEVLALAQKHRIPIIEDDPYYGLTDEMDCPPPIRALDSHGHVFYLGSFSKVLFMGLRVGWIHAPRPVIHHMAVMKQLSDLHTSSMSQWICLHFLKNRLIGEHLEKVLPLQRRKRDIMLASLDKWASPVPGITWTYPTGGLYLWMTFPKDFATSQFVKAAVQKGVAVVPGNVFSLDGSHRHCIRLNFTYPAEEKIDIGIRLLMEAVRGTMEISRKTEQLQEDSLPIL